jgi:hypothetical protein
MEGESGTRLVEVKNRVIGIHRDIQGGIHGGLHEPKGKTVHPKSLSDYPGGFPVSLKVMARSTPKMLKASWEVWRNRK